MTRRVLAGLGLSALIGGLARWRGMLTTGGVVGSVLIGAVVFGVGGLAWSIVVVVFFVSSSALSRVSSERKRRVAADKFSKPGARDALQTVANGGVGALAALAYALLRRPAWLHAAFVGAFATATADTWATEIGTLARGRPRLITTGKPVPPGTSGGVTWLGTSAALAGALTLGLTAALTVRTAEKDGASTGVGLAFAGVAGGLCGVLTDSLLGATVQRVYCCPLCESETERAVHSCGTRTKPVRGVRWMDNDMVNLLSTAAGAAAAAAMCLLLTRAGHVGSRRPGRPRPPLLGSGLPAGTRPGEHSVVDHAVGQRYPAIHTPHSGGCTATTGHAADKEDTHRMGKVLSSIFRLAGTQFAHLGCTLPVVHEAPTGVELARRPHAGCAWVSRPENVRVYPALPCLQ